jgi:hypothetical protein
MSNNPSAKTLEKARSYMDLKTAENNRQKRIYDSRPQIEMNVGLDMLDTSELLGYYKTVVSKGNRDLIVHQKQQSYLKKL